jgi:hypothetical protein
MSALWHKYTHQRLPQTIHLPLSMPVNLALSDTSRGTYCHTNICPANGCFIPISYLKWMDKYLMNNVNEGYTHCIHVT